MSDTGLEGVQASWWEELVPAHWWVELGLIPLVGRAVSRGVLRAGSGFRMTLGNLSADGWGCVPTLLVVWPEHGCFILEPAGCCMGPDLVPKWCPPGEPTPMNIPWGLYH